MSIFHPFRSNKKSPPTSEIPEFFYYNEIYEGRLAKVRLSNAFIDKEFKEITEIEEDSISK
jgi:hypothetical protein